MCGIVGAYEFDPAAPADVSLVRAMAGALAHRGPDDEGFYADGNVALGHRRLSIIDLEGGRQPIFNEDRSLAIVYNGEVYNYGELRGECLARGHRFETRTDTEVVLHLYEDLGPDALHRLNGMFAFAIWDAKRRELFLARDRLGVKPLYYTETTRRLIFASEIKAILLADDAPRAVDPVALDRYLAFLWVPEPDTILQGVRRLPPGHWMRVRGRAIEVARYWDLEFDAAGGAASDGDIVPRLRGTLEAAVSRQTVADVPVGAFLSGGLDSTTVVSLMVRAGRPPVRVYAARFDPEEQAYERYPDDAKYARWVARRLGLEDRYEEITLRPDTADLLPRLLWYLDEPMADPAIIPAYLICRAAQPHTKVLLSGMGGDELFAGYRRHLSEKLLGWYGRVPAAVRGGVFRRLAGALPSTGRSRFLRLSRYVREFVEKAEVDPASRYVAFCAWTAAAERRALLAAEALHGIDGDATDARHVEALARVGGADTLHRMLYLDTMLYLPSHNLNYTDKMSMAASVEVRVPLLDDEVVALAARIPARLKLRGLRGKHVLKRAMADAVPARIRRRPKAGFGAPFRAWILRDLREMIHDVLSERRLRARGLFDPGGVRALLDEHFAGRVDRATPIWALLTFELWADAHLGGGASAASDAREARGA